MTISALDKDTVKLISTTQIITSVSSATKELIENALDADAKTIEINLTDNGTTLIEVKDDGCGIAKADAAYMALSSHTSKILDFSDLETLETYGFRGEALYALSAVSDLTIISKTEQDEVATIYIIDHHGRIMKSQPCPRANGTTVQVRQLFKQILVRRQLITNHKKANQDIKILASLIKCYGICKFSTRISYKVDGNIIFAKPGMPTLEDAVTYVLGKKITSNMTWIDIEDAGINVKLMVPLQKIQNTSDVFVSGAQYIFVNNRPIKHKDLEKILIKTILEALEQDSSSRKKPVFVLYILTSAGNIDVNLDPNKSSIFFKEQTLILETIDKYIKNFYGIQREVQKESSSNKSLNGYLDYTQEANIDDVESEQPVCKKQKLREEEKVVKITENDVCPSQKSNDIDKNLNSENETNCKSNKQEEIANKNKQNNQDKNREEETKNFNMQIPVLNLSDSDSNDSQNFKNVDAKANTDDSPPIELVLQPDSLSQLPVVDLGEDFNWNNDSMTCNMDTYEKENKKENTNMQEENKSDRKKVVTLEEWSKGHVSGLKGGTDVLAYIDKGSRELLEDDSYHSNACSGFLKFSRQIRQQVTEQNPTMTAPQIARTVTNLWKKLSPEERGYYRDLARDEKLECDTKKQEIKTKHKVDDKKTCKSRILKVLEQMKTMNPEKKENLLMRTIVPWDMDLKKTIGSFLNNTECKNTNLVVGLLCSNLWIVHKSAHIWILDIMRLKKELKISDESRIGESAEDIELLLKQWFLLKDDLSLLHPIHSLTKHLSES